MGRKNTEPSPALAARARAERIRLSLSEAYEELVQAFALRDWETLGYASWDEYREQEFGEVLTRIADVHTRAEVHRALSDAGMSQRQVARSTGSSQSTVSRDLDMGDSDESRRALPNDIAEQVRAFELAKREHVFVVELKHVRSSAQSAAASLSRAIDTIPDANIPAVVNEYYDEAISALEDVTAVLERLRSLREVMVNA
jgi:predicted transcriptional regulator